MILLLSVTLLQLPQQALTKLVTSTAKKPMFTVKVQLKHKAFLNNNKCTQPTCHTTNTTTCLTNSTHTNNPRTVNLL